MVILPTPLHDLGEDRVQLAPLGRGQEREVDERGARR
jgi:hypothetical protein